ncbi:MAG: helix-turn-helix transcriptional regulator [Bacteroidaceae bacterium]|nr:helix-turn-helix transcriptional regulator [Bacteroidaceae bacterium]
MIAKQAFSSRPFHPVSAQSVSDVAMRCGFDDAAYFTRVFRSFHGCTPSQMKKN